MKNKDLALKLKAKEKSIIISRTKIATLYLGVPLVLSFSIIDYIYRPDLVVDFFVARIMVVPFSFFCYSLFKSKKINNSFHYIPAHIFTFFLGSYNAYLIYLDSLHHSLYFFGLTLAIVGSLAFLPWNPKHMAISTFSICFPTYGLMLLNYQEIDWPFLVPCSALLSSTILIGVTINLLTRNLRKSEIKNEIDLEERIDLQDKIINQKTREGIILEKMAIQFSPQVIKATKNGEISLTEKIERNITCIFIDIKNSTKRSQKINNKDYTNVISDFFSECTNILLKYNVTVGTYLGDGLLAFTNAPQLHHDHKKNALVACLEIIDFVRNSRLKFAESWRSEIKIRIGINEGQAIVGFFPNQKLGCYTAIGEPINLAARLCSVANDNSICISENLLHSANELECDNLSITKTENMTNLKSYEGKLIALYQLTKQSKTCSIAPGQICPSCNSEKLIVFEELDDSIILKCTQCSYYDFLEKESKSVAA